MADMSNKIYVKRPRKFLQTKVYMYECFMKLVPGIGANCK